METLEGGRGMRSRKECNGIRVSSGHSTPPAVLCSRSNDPLPIILIHYRHAAKG